MSDDLTTCQHGSTDPECVYCVELQRWKDTLAEVAGQRDALTRRLIAAYHLARIAESATGRIIADLLSDLAPEEK